MTIRRWLVLAVSPLLLVPPVAGAQNTAPAPVPASKAGDDFESGTLAGWGTHTKGPGGWFLYSDGTTTPEGSQSDPFYPFEAPNPPQGKFAVISDTDGSSASVRVLYRDVTLDGRYRLALHVFYVNEGRFTRLEDGLDDSQLYRIDIIPPDAPPATLATEHILATIFQGRPADPARQAPTELVRDLSPWAGRTIRLRFLSSDSEGPLRAGVDNIRFERID